MKSMNLRIWMAFFLLSSLAFDNLPFANSADFPTKPINLYVGMNPGGATDVAARILIAEANKYVSSPFIVVNKPGGGGVLATDFVCKAKPDGYTLNWTTLGTVIQPVVDPNNPFKLSDLTPIARVYQMPMAIVVQSDSKYKSLEDLIKEAKERPGVIAAGSPGVKSIWHFAMEMLMKEAGCKFRHVPFKSDAEVVTALLGKHVEVGFIGAPAATEYFKSGSLRGLAITLSQRASNMPDVPTLAERGYPRASVVTWGAIQGPAGISKEAVDKVSSAVEKALKSPELNKAYEIQGLLPAFMGATEVKVFITEEEKRIQEVAKSANLIGR
jgi:tripartite-type tricarboxylate transporter receptor subunit TctC